MGYYLIQGLVKKSASTFTHKCTFTYSLNTRLEKAREKIEGKKGRENSEKKFFDYKLCPEGRFPITLNCDVSVGYGWRFITQLESQLHAEN